jgi:CBS domain-containing protein
VIVLNARAFDRKGREGLAKDAKKNAVEVRTLPLCERRSGRRYGRVFTPVSQALATLSKELAMSTLRDLLKDRKVYSVDAARTVLEAARFMMEHNIGALPVLRNGELAGIFSERDIMNRVVAVGRTPGLTAVSEVMTANPRAVSLDETIEECFFIMHEFGFRHLPIVEGKELRGLVSLRDIVLRQAADLKSEGQRAS